MKPTHLISKQLRDVFFGGNWTASNLRDQLKDISIDEAKHQIADLNTILVLTFHIQYYIGGVIDFLNSGEMKISDKYAFTPPQIDTEEEWRKFQEKIWQDVETFAQQLENHPEKDLTKTFLSETYGTYYRNFHGIIEHTHYHLGQIAVIKKMVKNA